MSMSRGRSLGLIVLPLVLATGCASYRADPLDPTAELAAFTRRDLTTASASANPTATWDMATGLHEEHLVAIALRQHPALVVARARLGLADAVLIEAGLWPNPELSLSVRGGAPGVTGDLDLLAVLLRPGERAARRAAAEAGQRMAFAEMARDEWQVVAAVRCARLEIIASVAYQRAAQDTVELTRTAATALERRHALGDATELDLATGRAEAASAQRQLRAATAAVAAHERALNHLLGLPSTLVIPLAGRGEPLPVLAPAIALPADPGQEVLLRRWDLEVTHAAYNQAEQELRLAIAKQYPALRIGPSMSRDGEGTTFGAAVALELPIFDRNQGGIRAAEATRDAARARFQADLQNALAQVADASAELAQATAEITAVDADLMPAARRALDLADHAVLARDMGLIDYLVVRRAWLDAQRARLDAVTAAHRASIALDAALGRGSAALPHLVQSQATSTAGAKP